MERLRSKYFGNMLTFPVDIVGLDKFLIRRIKWHEPRKIVTSEEPLEKQLWKAADKLRKNIDAAEYKHIVLGLIFLVYF